MKDSKSKKSLKSFMITEIREKTPGSVNPVLVNFQNGQLNAQRTGDAVVSLTPNATGTNVRIEYGGDVFQEVNFDKPKTRQYLAVLNRKTQKMRLIEVDSALLINSALVPEEINNKEADVTDYGKDMTKLNKAFGGKKVKSRLQQRENLNINSMLMDDEIKVAVNDMVKESSEAVLSNSTLETESLAELLPPCNRSASNASDVYSLSEILGDEVLDALVEEVCNCNLEETLPEECSQFFKMCHGEAVKSGGNVALKIAGLLYVDAVFKFLKLPSKQLNAKRNDFCSYSAVVASKVIDDFCIKTGNTISRPLSMRDKALCYVMAIVLICCGFQINLKILSETASMGVNKLSRLARVVGAVPVGKNEVTYVLKLPLPPLPMSSAAKMKRK